MGWVTAGPSQPSQALGTTLCNPSPIPCPQSTQSLQGHSGDFSQQPEAEDLSSAWAVNLPSPAPSSLPAQRQLCLLAGPCSVSTQHCPTHHVGPLRATGKAEGSSGKAGTQKNLFRGRISSDPGFMWLPCADFPGSNNEPSLQTLLSLNLFFSLLPIFTSHVGISHLWALQHFFKFENK